MDPVGHEIERLLNAIINDNPQTSVRLDEPRSKEGEWWLDAKLGTNSVHVQWSAAKGFGISNGKSPSGFGEKPEAVFATYECALEHVLKLLNTFETPAETVPMPPQPELQLPLTEREQRLMNIIEQLEAKVCPQQHWGSRTMLPGRRNGYTQKFKLGSMSIFVRTGEYPDGKLGEIFLDVSKQDSTMRALFACFAISVSLGLQYGVPLDEFLRAFVNVRFEPSGPVTGHDKIKRAKSIIDLIFRDLAHSYSPDFLDKPDTQPTILP